MPKKFDPDCVFCQANRDDGAPEGYRRIARMERTVLYLDAAQRVVLVASAHIASADEMHPKERELFGQDMARATEAVSAVCGTAAQMDVLSGEHLHIQFAPALVGAEALGNAREALGFIREPVSNPLLRNWVNEKGEVFDWPNLKHPDEQAAVREYLASKFQPNYAYTEKEVNALLNTWATFGDWALLRRELFMHGYLKRFKDGTKYWVGDEEPV